MNNKYSHISHISIPIFINQDSSILILGSLPSVKTREVGFYYGHKQNRFYKVLSKLYLEETPLSVEDKKDFLNKHHIALYDVIYECDIIGSSDASIRNPVVIDIKDILYKYPNIKKIALNGNKAKSLFNKYLLEIVNNEFKDIKIYYLPSTSPANAKMNIDDLLEAYKALLE